jgi:nucleoid DNA-binding protein
VKFLTKKELADEVAAKVKISKKDAAAAVDARRARRCNW